MFPLVYGQIKYELSTSLQSNNPIHFLASSSNTFLLFFFLIFQGEYF